jgi:D-threo-aldose 1-dehydrogenase
MAIAREHDVPLGAAAVRFALAHLAVAAAVLGATRAAEVEANPAGDRRAMPAAFRSALEAAGLIASALPLPGGAA